MRRAATLAALGIAAYFTFLLATLPAGVAAQHLHARTSGAVQLLDVHGTVWSGHARAVIAPPRAAPLEVDRVEWRWLPARLLAAEIAFAASASARDFAVTLTTARGLGGLETRDVEGRAEARALAILVPIAATWQPGGSLRFTVPRLTREAGALAGEATVEWRGATTALSAVQPLGSYRAQVKAGGGGARATVATLEGPLAIQGTGTLAASGAATFSGEARADAAKADALAPLLTLLGPRRADGAHAIEWRQ